MRTRKSKFLAFLFALLPGAGHMYLGFMKLGVSYMAPFFFICFLSSWLDLGPLLFLLPVLWFYAFFDCMNRLSIPDEERAAMEDHYLFVGSYAGLRDRMGKNGNLVLGVALLFIGVVLFGKYFLLLLDQYVSIWSPLRHLFRYVPQFLFGALIVAAGVWLILGRKKELDDASDPKQ